MHTHSVMSNGAKSVNMLSTMLFDLYFGGGATSTPDASTWLGSRFRFGLGFGIGLGLGLGLGLGVGLGLG
jgi:hypothetical protein